MADPSSPKEFNKIAKYFHWMIFLLFLFQYGIAIIMYGVAREEFYPKNLFIAHKSVGALLFFLAISRLLWRKMNPLPPWPDSMTDFENKSFHWTLHPYVFNARKRLFVFLGGRVWV